jgi:L-fucose isomerase-like protein
VFEKKGLFMKQKLQFDVPLRVAVVAQDDWGLTPDHIAAARSFFNSTDTVDVMKWSDVAAAGAIDIAFCTAVCGSSGLAQALAPARIPALAIFPSRSFHPYHAAFYRELEQRGGIRLPANTPEEIAASVRAVRARKALKTMKLIVAELGANERRQEELRRFSAGARDRLGVEILIRDVSEMKERAAAYDDAAADRELKRWYAEVLEGPGEMNEAHMRQVAKLYLAQCAMLDETGAVGITPQEIGGFLCIPNPVVMPNVSYGPLAADGYLVCEEGDIEVLASELLLYAGLGAHPTMSNIYYAYRDRFTALDSHKDYTPELELEDCRQCFADNHITAAHFSTSGVLPPAMMVEKRYRVREALPSWPGQSMIASTPKLGPVVMARLSGDATTIHSVPGEADGLGQGDHYGWYRGRWFIRVPDARDFVERCLYQHYAIGPSPHGREALETLCSTLLGLRPA